MPAGHAQQARLAWAALPYVERARVLRRAAALFEKHHAEQPGRPRDT
ncbi:hypothetical protein [Streptomyces sp. NPDC005374]